MEEKRSWWQQIKQRPYATGVVVLVVFILFIFLAYRFGWDWTGFNATDFTSTPQKITRAIVYQPEKALWDWLQLLFIPAILTLGAVWITARQNHDREIAVDNQSERALQAFLSKMSDLLLGQPSLADSPEGHVIRKIARAQTLTVLPRLDGERKRSLLQFLYESDLINTDKPIIHLNGADLKGAHLHEAQLKGVNLTRADLSGANLSGSIFFSIIYVPRAFGGTIVIPNHADLSGADLSGAKVTDEQLAKAASLEGATMPDGSIHP